ncbi:Coenzyme F420 hydrogenase/dehydrogenase, beta subunit C-terminal domain [Natronoglomus mannanivorans]|uniref:Coenzyme F420 hydrogenase/dehydrogenase, beta subunit C-terminal domain n=1 Tax=Natronoglomus mannanivorans TaxID=2979990 RepID=A0AAP2YYB7_9EURY|nr:Coenzyme F420 hydrogenase/dehydrogenase, beta subunit C-terminal domain [Halobacteria archaeon AArc-xg1-1]
MSEQPSRVPTERATDTTSSENETDGPRTSGVGGDPRELADVTPDPGGKTWFRDLDEAVIESDRCIQCGTCVAACPSDSIGIDETTGRPTLVRMCTGCSRCWDFCPRSGLRYERVLEFGEEPEVEASATDDSRAGTVGAQETTYAARARDTATNDAGQDGGAVTTLLAELLEAGEIDGAIVAGEREDEPLRGEAVLATSREELLATAGSVYSQTMQLGRIHDLLEASDIDERDPQLALVGTPCVIEGAAALERYDWDGETDPIALTVALMCTRSFEHERLRSSIADCGVDPAAVEKLDVSDGVLYASDDDGETLLEEAIDTFDTAALRGCAECADFVGGAADISAGSVGSDESFTTMVVRTDRGERAWEIASSGLETAVLEETDALDKIAAWNRRRARETLPREFDPEGSVGITYEDHRAAYDGTDRDLEPLNPARVHQYEEWC